MTMPNDPLTPATAPTSTDWVEDTIANLPPLARVPEVTAVLRVSSRTLRRMVAAGKIRGVKLGAGKGSDAVLIPRVELARFLRSRVSG